MRKFLKFVGKFLVILIIDYSIFLLLIGKYRPWMWGDDSKIAFGIIAFLSLIFSSAVVYGSDEDVDFSKLD